jgi:PmbA protein
MKMIKELFQETIKETSVNVTSSRIDSIMKKEIVKSGCRVYDNGFIGIAGTLGEPADFTWEEAKENLSKEIPYPFEPESNNKRVRDLRNNSLSEEDFVLEMESFVDELHKEYPDFIFSNKVKLVESEIRLKNDLELDYVNYDKSFLVELIVKHKDSVDIFDTAIVRMERDFKKDEILKEAKEMLTNFTILVDLPEKDKIPVIFTGPDLMGIFSKSLHGETLGLKTSIFSDKLNKQVFHKDFTLYQDVTEDKIHRPFFDMEGVVNTGEKHILIENGLIIKGYTDKKVAKTFSYPLTGAAGGEYDEVPTLDNVSLSIKSSDKSLKEILNGSFGILIVFASGGDYSADGNYASPAQMSYLTDGERLLGKLPEFSISGSVYDMFGSDFMGVSKDRPFMGEKALVVNMKIS